MLGQIVTGLAQTTQVYHPPHPGLVGCGNKVFGGFTIATLESGPPAGHGMHQIVGRIDSLQRRPQSKRLKHVGLHGLYTVRNTGSVTSKHAAQGAPIIQQPPGKKPADEAGSTADQYLPVRSFHTVHCATKFTDDKWLIADRLPMMGGRGMYPHEIFYQRQAENDL